MSEREIDLPQHIVSQIVDCIAGFREVEEARVFGSRALGNAKRGSDIDLVLYGSRITETVLFHIRDYLEEKTTIPHFFDILHFEKINNSALRDHITTYGRTIYKKNHPPS